MHKSQGQSLSLYPLLRLGFVIFYHLVGLVVKVSTLGVEDPEFDFDLRYGDFSGLSHNSDLEIGTPMAILPGAWHYKVSAGTGWLCVKIL